MPVLRLKIGVDPLHASALLEPPRQPVLFHLIHRKHPAAHGDVDAWLQAVQGTDRQTQVEQGVRVAKACRLHGAGQYDDLAFDIGKVGTRDGHGIGTVGDQYVIVGAGGNARVNQLAVSVVQFQAVLAHQRLHAVLEAYPGLGEQLAYHRLADLVLAERVEIDLVDGPASGENLYEHAQSLFAGPSMTSDVQENSPLAAVPSWWVYMVRAANGHLYTGISTDPARRFRQHQRGSGARFFRRSPAVALVWYDRCADHSAALRRELAIKALSKLRKEELISAFDDAPSVPTNACAEAVAGAKLAES